MNSSELFAFQVGVLAGLTAARRIKDLLHCSRGNMDITLRIRNFVVLPKFDAVIKGEVSESETENG